MLLAKTKGLFSKYYHCLSVGEIWEIIVIPVVLAILSTLLFVFFVKENTKVDFLGDFISSLQSMAAIMTAFGIAGITIILTSSSDNIRAAKELSAKVQNKKYSDLSYYQLVLIRCNYNTVIQFVLLCFVLFGSVFLIFIPGTIYYSLLSLVLIHSLVVQFQVILTIYHLMWRNDNTKFTMKS